MKEEIKEVKIEGNQIQIGNTVYTLEPEVIEYILRLKEELEETEEDRDNYQAIVESWE